MHRGLAVKLTSKKYTLAGEIAMVDTFGNSDPQS